MSNEQVPQSMKDNPCVHCDGYEVRFDEERQLYLCICYWQPELRRREVLRPDWDTLKARAKKAS